MMQPDPLRLAASTALGVARSELKVIAREVDSIASGAVAALAADTLGARIARAQDAVRGALAIAPESFTAHGRNQALEAVQALESFKTSFAGAGAATVSAADTDLATARSSLRYLRLRWKRDPSAVAKPQAPQADAKAAKRPTAPTYPEFVAPASVPVVPTSTTRPLPSAYPVFLEPPIAPVPAATAPASRFPTLPVVIEPVPARVPAKVPRPRRTPPPAPAAPTAVVEPAAPAAAPATAPAAKPTSVRPPTPVAAPEPAPTPTVTPEPAPKPAPEPAPTPAPEPSPAPAPTPRPAPVPGSHPAPTTTPAPVPTAIADEAPAATADWTPNPFWDEFLSPTPHPTKPAAITVPERRVGVLDAKTLDSIIDSAVPRPGRGAAAGAATATSASATTGTQVVDREVLRSAFGMDQPAGPALAEVLRMRQESIRRAVYEANGILSARPVSKSAEELRVRAQYDTVEAFVTGVIRDSGMTESTTPRDVIARMLDARIQALRVDV